MLADPARAVKVGVRPFRQDLRQAAVDIAEGWKPTAERGQPVGMVVDESLLAVR
jgi:hypothetical protein